MKKNMAAKALSEPPFDMKIVKDSKFPNFKGSSCSPHLKVESCKHFKSLRSTLVVPSRLEGKQEEYKPDRISFYKTLLNYGLVENVSENRRQGTQKDEVWQNELKDLLWLELQAFQHGRTAVQHDEYLCEARKLVQSLLDDIMTYRFNRLPIHTYASVEGANECNAEKSDDTAVCEGFTCNQDCLYNNGCLSMFCVYCIEQQNKAFREVETLLNRLEDALALYPSCKAFGAQYPLVLGEPFNARVKALCIWYNMSKHHRLTALILGRHLMQVQELMPTTNESSSVEENERASDGCASADSGYSSTSDIGRDKFTFTQYRVFERNNTELDDCYDTRPILNLGRHFVPVVSSNSAVFAADYSYTYRKYIQTVLKTKGLRKALFFLEKLHLTLLHTSNLTLLKPISESDINNNANNEDKTNRKFHEELELRKYGYCSSVSQSLNLPSYRSAFLFIARVPLDVIHAFLQMRLETKPVKPSALSIRQLLGELKEGLGLAVVNRQRYFDHVLSVLWDVDEDVKDNFNTQMNRFDTSVCAIFQVYLDYLTQWIQLIQQEKVQKNILEEEWNFTKSISGHIPHGIEFSAKCFCNIAIGLLDTVCMNLKDNAKALIDATMKHNESESIKHSILFACRELQCLCGLSREKSLRILALTKLLCKDLESNKNLDPSCAQVISKTLIRLQKSMINLCYDLKEVVLMVERVFCISEDVDDIETIALQSRLKETLHQLFKFTFEYFKEVIRSVHGDIKAKLTDLMMYFVHLWINFVQERYERGRGLKPRWATQGLEFLLLACEPQNTVHMADDEFEEFKNAIDKCVSFIFGTTECDSQLIKFSTTSTKYNVLSPTSLTMRKKLRSSSSDQTTSISPFQSPDKEPQFLTRETRMLNAISALDTDIERKLQSKELIGTVCQVHHFEGKDYIKPRTVTFSWQRGIKIGQGRFGKVYTVVNNETGELLAMKEIQLQPFDHKAIRRLALELRTFEGINHENLIRYYGVEVHKEEMLIFMELCPEGTLEYLVNMTENGLPESLVRRYMKQLVTAVDILHKNTIVHRDVKSANIFLASEGNILKLGDFGSAVKIKANSTIPGELRGFVGTQAYMAPEVFMDNNMAGYGRAADIWSLGCVLVEIASGKRPWSEYDSDYQIIFKVGMGQTPLVPDTLSEEGHHFAFLCLQHNPRKRANTSELLEHTFLKVDGDGDDCVSCSFPSIFEDYLKLGLKI